MNAVKWGLGVVLAFACSQARAQECTEGATCLMGGVRLGMTHCVRDGASYSPVCTIDLRDTRLYNDSTMDNLIYEERIAPHSFIGQVLEHEGVDPANCSVKYGFDCDPTCRPHFGIQCSVDLNYIYEVIAQYWSVIQREEITYYLDSYFLAGTVCSVEPPGTDCRPWDEMDADIDDP